MNNQNTRSLTNTSRPTLLAALLILMFTSQNAFSEQSFECDNEHSCIPENSWQIGLAFGLGGRTNPLVDGDNIPFVVLPDIAYYGESIYFDNGELGWQLTPSNETSVELFVAPNTERANFSFWHTANLFLPATAFDSSIVTDEQSQNPLQESVSVDDVTSRKWALDAGIRWQWYGRSHQLSVAFAGDVSGVYQGSHAAFKYRYLTQLGDWQLSLSPHLKWHSGALSDYYYGVSAEDTEQGILTYSASSGLQYGFTVNGGYRINENWHGLIRVSFTQLHTGMTDSPLVEDSSIYSAFAGIAYRF